MLQQSPRPSLNKVILFLTDACNLRCSYCYENQSHCTPQSSSMTEDTASRIVLQLFSRYSSCGFIQFFGGEPSLNLRALKRIVQDVERICSENNITSFPKFGIVTNGTTRKSDELIDFCRDHKISVTVSIDGPPLIHDTLRPDIHGKGSFCKATETVERLLAEGVQTAIESVYTTHHIENQFTIVDLMEFISFLGVNKLILHTAFPPAPMALCPFDDHHFSFLEKYHVDAVDWWFNLLVTQNEKPIEVYFKDLLVPLLKGMAVGVAGGGCPAGTRNIAIGPKGDIYSCHLLYRNSSYYQGNILDKYPFVECAPIPRTVDEFSECNDCIARYWCQPCGALNLNWSDAWKLPHRECELRKVVFERIASHAFKCLNVPSNWMTDRLRNKLWSKPSKLDYVAALS